jgi:hypothetical protein
MSKKRGTVFEKYWLIKPRKMLIFKALRKPNVLFSRNKEIYTKNLRRALCSIP